MVLCTLVGVLSKYKSISTTTLIILTVVTTSRDPSIRLYLNPEEPTFLRTYKGNHNKEP